MGDSEVPPTPEEQAGISPQIIMSQDVPPDWLAGGGEMRRLIRNFDWSKHRLGPPQLWPQSLKTVIRMMLDSRYAMWMGWGSDLTFFYNDAYARDTLGKKHPSALGRPARDVWAEIWTDIKPRIERVLSTGESTWDEGLLLFLERSGFLEETYHTFSYSPLYDEAGRRGGMLCVVTEETKRVISERRLALLRELGANTTLARTVDEACHRFVQTLEQNPADVPFALVYLIDNSHRKLLLKGAAQVPENHPAHFAEIPLDDNSETKWPVAQALSTKKPVVISDLETRFGKFHGGNYSESPKFAMALPIPGVDAEHPVGAVVVGVSPRLAVDYDYEGFFQLVVGQFATAISNAQSYEKERQRAEALAELDRTKTAFFSNVSHEFRTPLTLMLGPLQELLHRNADTLQPRTREELEVVHRNSLRLLKLVNTLLDFSRIEAGRVQANFEPTDICLLTRDLASAFRSTIEKAGLRFDVQCAALPAPVYVDRDMWEKIVFNLLSNAFKFTLGGGVSVHLTQEKDEAVLTVTDTGAGIPPEELQNIFKRFHRVQNVRARTHEGTGIGLALVHELVKLHGGSISVDSRVGEGTTFTVRIPMGSNHLPADRIHAPQRQVSTAIRGEAFVEEASRWKLMESAPRSEAPAPPQESITSAKRPRILVADDNADMREYISRLLQGRYELETVADGAAVLEAAHRQQPDVIVSDVMMPGMDGFTLLRAIREDVSLRTVPVIFLSARAGAEALIEGIEQGADDYLVKPFSGRELIARLETHLKLARIRQEALARERTLRQESESVRQRLDSVLSGMDEQFLLLDHDWRFVYVNDRLVQSSGLARERLLGNSIWELFPPARTGQFRDEVMKAAAEKKPVRFEFFYEPWDRWSDVRVYPTAEGVVILTTDITQRRSMENALELSEERFRLAAFSDAITMYEQDAELRYTWLYPVHPEITNAIGKTDLELQPGEDGELLMQWKREVMATGQSQRREAQTNFAGETKVYDVLILPKRNAAGAIVGVAGTALDISKRKEVEEKLKERTRSLELINRVGATVAAELDLEKLVQSVTDAGREISGAEFGAFFYNINDDKGESYMLYTLSGAPREAFSKFPMPRNTAVFGPTFKGEGIIRIPDVLQDPRYGKNAPYYGMPKGHLPVRSYLAAPVVSRSGEVLG